MQSGNTRGTTRLAREDRFHSRGTALQQCARKARVLEDNSRVFLEYSKTTREFYSSTRRQHALFCKLWRDFGFGVTGTVGALMQELKLSSTVHAYIAIYVRTYHIMQIMSGGKL